MELLTKELEAQLLAGNDEDIVCKFFNPVGAGTWLITRMDDDRDTLWCLADLGMDCVESGTVSLSELKGTRLPGGLSIERDICFKPNGRKVSDFAYRDSLSGVA